MIINSLSPLRDAMVDSLQDSVFNVEDTRIIQRYISEFFSAQSQHLVADSDIDLAGDFDISFNYSGNSASFRTLVGGSDGTRFFRIESGGFVRAYGAAINTTGSVSVTDGYQHNLRSVRSGDTLTLYIDGVPDATITNALVEGSMKLNEVAAGSTGVADGRYSDLIVKDGASEVVDLTIDEDGSSNTVVNYAGSNNFTRVNMTTANAKEFIFDGSASPNTWTDVDTGLDVIEVAGT